MRRRTLLMALPLTAVLASCGVASRAGKGSSAGASAGASNGGFEVTDVAFGQRRKTLRAALKNWAGGPEASEALLSAVGIDPTRRGETLSIEEFVELGRAVIEARGRGALAASTAAR